MQNTKRRVGLLSRLLPRVLMAGALATVSAGVACAPSGSTADAGPVDRTTYPTGPYGVEAGDVLESHTLVTTDGEDTTLDTLYFKDEGARLLLISTAAEWCSACIEEQGALQQRFEEHKDKGLRILVALFEDSGRQPAGADHAAEWADTHSVTFDVLADPEFVFSAYYDPAVTPMNMLVDVDTMEILRIQTGWDPATVDALIAARLGS